MRDLRRCPSRLDAGDVGSWEVDAVPVEVSAGTVVVLGSLSPFPTRWSTETVQALGAGTAGSDTMMSAWMCAYVK